MSKSKTMCEVDREMWNEQQFGLCINTMFIMFRRDYMANFPNAKVADARRAFLNGLHERMFEMKPNKLLQREIDAIK